RKRRGQAVDSEPVQKRSTLLASSAGGTSGAQPTDREESGPLDFELASPSPVWLVQIEQQTATPSSQSLLGSLSPSASHLTHSVLSSDDEDETRANDVCVTATASEQQGSSDEHTSSSKAWQPAIRCPICMDFYSQIRQSERLFLVTKCGHIFCSRCLPAAFEVSSACPTCRTEFTPKGYHPIY
ncbi:RNF4 ligase, partial [Sakesphorus luctuosus]|nr:RNF4 ligase [Sakesphorus luctuosus]